MRPAAVAVLCLIAAAVGGISSLAVAEATGLGGETKTVIVGAAPREQGEPARLELRDAAAPLGGDGFEPARIYSARASGVVTIYALFGGEDDEEGGASQGSGFVVSSDGLILTNSHVITTAGEAGPNDRVRTAARVYVQFRDGDRVGAKLVGWDPFTDVAVLRVAPAGHALKPVPLGDSTDIVVGEPVAAIGSPFGNASSLSVGVVSASRSIASLTSRYSVVDAIQTDAPINRGNSGGPLFDARGRVIGINAQIRSDNGNNEGVGFAIPINTARRSLEQLVSDGEVSYAYVGVLTTDLTPSAAEHFDLPVRRGAVVTDVTADSPAEAAGFRAGAEEVDFNGLSFPLGGDVIVAIDGRPMRSADDVVRYVSEELRPGDVAVFTVVRDARRRRIAVELGERPLPR